jgi:hypothetical protein
MEVDMKQKSLRNLKGKMTLNENMRDYSNDPFFQKQYEEAVAFFEKNGIPGCVTNRGKKKK